jgi:hypothetical protein
VQEASTTASTQEEEHTSFLRSIRRGLIGTAAFIGGAVGIGVWDSTAPTSYMPWFIQAESLLRHALPLWLTNQLALTDGDQVYQATIMVGSGLIAYFSLRDPKLSKLKDKVTRNISTLLMWLPNMVLGDLVSASLRVNHNAYTVALVAPDPAQTGAWRGSVTQHSFLHPFVQWGDSSISISPSITHFYELAFIMAGAYVFTRTVGFKLYDKYQAKRLLRQEATT